MLIAWPITRQGHWMAWIVSHLNFGFIVDVGILFVPSVTDMLDFFKMIPPGARILFAIPWIIGILSLGLLVYLVRMWKDENFTVWGQVKRAALVPRPRVPGERSGDPAA